MLGLEPYRDYTYQVFALASIFLVPDLIFFALQSAKWGNVFFMSLFGALAFIHLVALIYNYVVTSSCWDEVKQSHRQINELMNTLMAGSVESGGSPPALMSAQTYILHEVKITLSEWKKTGIIAVQIAVPILVGLPQFLKAVFGE